MTANSRTDAAREALQASLEAGDTLRAVAQARALFRADGSARQAAWLRRAVAQNRARLQLQPWRVALLSSFSIEFLHDSLIAQGFLAGLDITLYQPGFDQYRQEILDPGSGLYSFAPNAVVLAVEGRRWLPALHDDYLAALPDLAPLLSEAHDSVRRLVDAFRSRSSAALLLHNVDPPAGTSLGTLDGRVGRRQAHAFADFNEGLDGLARTTPGVYIVDVAGLVRRHGARNWYDLRMDHVARAPISQSCLPALAAEQVKFFRALSGRTKKVLVVDLDNTLWGGIVGEDGVHGLALGPDYPGSAYVQFQRQILQLRDRGIVLALASKNNRDEVETAFRTHPHMVLKLEHFSCLQIHWQPKSRSLAAIAEQLDLGLDSFVFVDDNPVECAEVAEALPQVAVLPLPKQPEQYGAALEAEALFDTLELSAEDRRRADLYRQHSQVAELRAGADSLEDFYRRLDLEVIVGPVDDSNVARVAQLTQKTNQFNLTTLRYSETQIRARCADPDWWLLTVRVRDCFGDNGLVGVLFAHLGKREAEIDTFLLSCRVIGRTIETALLAYLCEQARSRGLKRVRGRFVSTAKNAPAREVYPRHGFEPAGSEGDETFWVLDLARRSVAVPAWVRLVRETKG
jgi:FkbH-like protein